MARPVARPVAADVTVDRRGLDGFIRSRHSTILCTQRGDGTPQMSPVTMGVDTDGSILVSSYPERAKVRNLRARPQASVWVLSETFGGERVQASGSTTVVDVPEAVDGLVACFRSISGEHPDWDEYRQAMIDQGKVLIRLEPERWGPISRGGFPPRLAGG